AMERGAEDYLTKPFDDIELLNAIETRFRKREKRVVKHVVANKSSAQALQLREGDENYLLPDLGKEARVEGLQQEQHICEAGDEPLFIFYLLKGKIRRFLLYQDGRELSTGIHIDDSFFGYEALLLNEQYSDNAEVLEDCEVALIPKERFFEL